MNPQKTVRVAAVVLFIAMSAVAWHAIADAQGVNSRVPKNKVDAIFSKWTSSTPGCAVGASVEGQPVLQKAYGMADLEHDVKNVPNTIFEAGSVSKQFTAAAVL